MLKLVNIKKDYLMKDQEPVHALKGLSVNFRRNEFVAILGPSGCGKTTLLNITGGLDRYSGGDLIINGTSTKSFDDREWDTYRNHSIGFVFQSYNLIPHQTILKNVELALTIAGLDKNERKDRATKALEKVGLKGLEKKKPNQLSGGQMQRVAIARALVNEPEIVLADEPTGALDSETSIQVMDLLKEVAKDCLVIMVTHNPELADAYANRIIRMKDGELLSDTNPFSIEEEAKEVSKHIEKPKTELVNKGNKKKSSMSFLTASALSFSNLISKLKRTILIAIAGSIGIIGVSAVLAVSNGVSGYVDNMQDDMLSRYPLEIAEKSIDYSSLMSGLSNWDKKVAVDFDPRTEVGLNSMVKYLIDKYNDLFSLKENEINENLLAYINQIDPNDLAAIAYNYNIDPTNNLFTTWKKETNSREEVVSLNGLTQMYISELSTFPDFGVFSMFMDFFTNFMDQIPGDADFILSQYDLIAGDHLATDKNELMLVVDDDQTLTDLVLAQAGYYNQKEFLSIALKAIKESEGASPEEIAQYDYPEKFKFDELLDKDFYYVPDVYGDEPGTISSDQLKYYADFSGLPIPNNPYKTVEFDMTYTESESGGILHGDGFGVPICLTRSNYNSGEPYPFPEEPWRDYWKSKLSFLINETKVDLDYVVDLGMTNPGMASITLYLPGAPGLSTPSTPYYYEHRAINAYKYNAFKTDTINSPDLHVQPMKIAGILKKKKNIQFGSLKRGLYYTSAFAKEYIQNGLNNAVITSTNPNVPGLATQITSNKNEKFYAFVEYNYSSFANSHDDLIGEEVSGFANSLNLNLSSSISNMIGFTSVSNIDINRAYLRAVAGMSSHKINGTYVVSFDLDEQMPESIQIYPKDFNCKKHITKHLKGWNADNDITVVVNGETRVLRRENRTDLSYTDTVELIINIINTLILTVTIALIAFTSLALVVSCFMIAVITYISTMERVKEIGVIRSLGGRKKDVSRLFIAECLIIGLASGLIGIFVTYIFQIIFNLAISSFNVGNMANLTPITALIMITISILLNVLSGFIPSRRASRQDPVVALRSE